MRQIEAEWQASGDEDQEYQNWNLAPTQPAWIIKRENGSAAPIRMGWGLLPVWAKERHKPSYNARVETAHEKPYFRSAWKNGRCLVPVDGYYEWQKLPDKSKLPTYLYLKDGGPLLLAGLFDADGNKDEHFAIVTRQAEGALADIHGRTPFAVKPSHALDWLGGAQAEDCGIDDMSGAMSWHSVSDLVNSVKNNGPQLIQGQA